MKKQLQKNFWAFFCALIVLLTPACKDVDGSASRSDARPDQDATSKDGESDSASIESEQDAELPAADSADTMVDEAKGEFNEFLKKSLLKGSKDSYLFVNVPKDSSTPLLYGSKVPIYSEPKVFEYNNLKYRVTSYDVSNADKLNGIEWRGEGEIHCEAYRWKNVGGKWSEWQDFDRSIIKTVAINKSNDNWTIDGTDKNYEMHKPREIDMKSDAEFLESFEDILIENKWSLGDLSNYHGELVMDDHGNFKIDAFDMIRKSRIIANGRWHSNERKNIVLEYTDREVLHRDEYQVESAGINNCKLTRIVSGNSILPENLELIKDLRSTEYYTSLHDVSISEPLEESGENAYRLLILPNNLRIEVPINWVAVSDDWNQTIAANAQAAIDLSGVELPSTGDKLVYRSTSRPRSTYASLSIHAGPKEFDPEELRNSSEEEIKEATIALREMIEKIMAVNRYTIKEFKPVSIIDVDGHVGMLIQYIRDGSKGDVSVRTVRLIVDELEITVEIAHRISEEKIWGPITQYMKESMRIGK